MASGSRDRTKYFWPGDTFEFDEQVNGTAWQIPGGIMGGKTVLFLTLVLPKRTPPGYNGLFNFTSVVGEIRSSSGGLLDSFSGEWVGKSGITLLGSAFEGTPYITIFIQKGSAFSNVGSDSSAVTMTIKSLKHTF